jgi:electron transport complex protein RnfB
VDHALSDQINDLLPQTQCTKCGFEGCKPYAKAIARGEADINQCPPGGQAGIAKLAALLGREVKALNPANGEEGPRRIAFIDEQRCIGCTLCIKACPVDAIVGASKHMHAVIPALCTGCDLCLPPCPVDCIDMRVVPGLEGWGEADADAARMRFYARKDRLKREHAENDARLAAKAAHKLAHLQEHAQEHVNSAAAPQELDRKRAVIEAALERARARREAAQNP